jgi:hypothetical protein
MIRRHNGLSVLWELPLGLGSFLFYKSVKAVMLGLLHLHNTRTQEACKWQPVSDVFLSRPLALPLVMTSGPRWNTHALIATLAPVVVHESLEIDAGAADRSARSWTVVVCTHPARRTVTSVGSLSSPYSGGKARIELPPGKYWLGLRYYHWRPDAELPAVRADGRDVAERAIVTDDVNGFYRGLKQRSNIFYVALHYYVFVLLRYRRWFPAWFVDREFLPLGNPETEFYFGALRKGERLELRIAPEALAGWDVLVTLYDKGSFPTDSEQATQPHYEIAARDGARMYLVRVLRRSPGPGDYRREWVEVTK